MLNKLIADTSLTRLTEVEIINRNTVIKSIIAATVGLLMSSTPTRAISLVQNTNQPVIAFFRIPSLTQLVNQFLLE